MAFHGIVKFRLLLPYFLLCVIQTAVSVFDTFLITATQRVGGEALKIKNIF